MKSKIKWKACGFDLQDRKGSSDGLKDEVQITFSRGKFDVAFHHAKKATLDSMEEAKQYAEDNLEQWQQARKDEREAYEAQRKAEAKRSKDASDREAKVAAQLQALGIEVRVGFGILLPIEVAEALVGRLQGSSPITKPINPEPALGFEMAILVAS